MTGMTLRTQSLNLQTKTFLYLLLILAPIFAAGWLATVAAGNETKAQVGKTLLELAGQTHKTVDRDLLGINESTIKMIQEPLIQSLGSDAQKTPEQIFQQYLDLNSLLVKYGVSESFYIGLKYSFFIPVQDPSRYKFAPDYHQLENGVFYIDPSKSAWYQQALSLKGKGSLLVLDHFGVTRAGKTLTYLRLVNDFSTNLHTSLGIIAVTDLQYVLQRELNDLKLPGHTFIYLTNAANQLLAGNTDLPLGGKVPVPDEYLRQEAGNRIIKFQGEPYLLVYHASGNFNTKLIFLTPISQITAQETKIQQLILLLTGIYLLIVMLSVGVFMRSILIPIRRLGSAVQAYVPGKDSGIGDQAKPRKDEIGGLTQSFVRMTLRLNDMIENQYVMEIKQKETELSMLQQQINPHLLYNTLESIYWRGVSLGQHDVADMVKDLSKLMRIGLSQGRSLIPLAEEVEHAKAYIRLQEKRDRMSFQVIWQVDERCLQAPIPKITLQPLLENAILHGIAAMEDEGEIRVTIREREDRQIEIEVADNGFKPVDIDQIRAILHDEVGARRSVGIWNVQQRIQLHFGQAYGLDYAVGPNGGVVATIRIPGVPTSDETGGGDDGERIDRR